MGRRLKLKCLVKVDHLKLTKKEVPLIPLDNFEEVEEPEGNVNGAVGGNQEEPDEVVDAVDGVEERKTTEYEEQQPEYKPNCVYSSWLSAKRIPGSMREGRKKTRLCLISADHIKKYNVRPAKFEVIESDSRSANAQMGEPSQKRVKQEEVEVNPGKGESDALQDNLSLAETTTVRSEAYVTVNAVVEPKEETSVAPVMDVVAFPDQPDGAPTIPPERRVVMTPMKSYASPIQPCFTPIQQCSTPIVSNSKASQPSTSPENPFSPISVIDVSTMSGDSSSVSSSEEVSTPKGPGAYCLEESPELEIPYWVKPEVLLEEVFQKKKVLRCKGDDDNDYVLPTDPEEILTSLNWQVRRLDDLKAELNRVKSQLDNLPLDEWHSHTKKMNIAHSIVPYIKGYFNPEFASIAWGKMFEMLCEFEVIPAVIVNEIDNAMKSNAKTIPFDSMHLCEAPGAFVSALNHYLQISYPNMIDWKWIATTLNPYYEGNDVGTMINDDRLITKSSSQWVFLDDNTGNILKQRNFRSLVEAKKDKLDKNRQDSSGNVSSRLLLVTADGSIDCQGNPAEQESMVAHLQYGEVVAALKMLSKGGTFILKIFTFLEAATICHLYLLSCVFEEVHLFKPATSKEGNSEVYVVCLGYKGTGMIAPAVGKKLVASVETYGQQLKEGKLLLSFAKIPKTFMNKILDAAEFFCNYQMKIIQRNFHTFESDLDVHSIMQPFRREAAEQWIQWSEIQRLKPQYRLFSGDANNFKISKAVHLDARSEQGSFADKVKRKFSADEEKLSAIEEEINRVPRLLYSDTRSAKTNTGDVIPSVKGLPYENIYCSRFCNGRILSLRDEVRKIAAKSMHDLEENGFDTLGNECVGHSKMRLMESLVLSSLKSEQLEELCFNTTTYEHLLRSDFEQQAIDLQKFYQAVRSRSEGQSLFLCRYHVLTRLQAGFLSCLGSLFEEVLFHVNPRTHVVGILLHKFKRITTTRDRDMMKQLEIVLKQISMPNCVDCELEVVPVVKLLEHFPTEFVVQYNLMLITRDISRIINVTNFHNLGSR